MVPSPRNQDLWLRRRIVGSWAGFARILLLYISIYPREAKPQIRRTLEPNT